MHFFGPHNDILSRATLLSWAELQPSPVFLNLKICKFCIFGRFERGFSPEKNLGLKRPIVGLLSHFRGELDTPRNIYILNPFKGVFNNFQIPLKIFYNIL